MPLDLTLTTEQKQKVILAPTTAQGNPATLDGEPVWSVVSGAGTVQPEPGGLSAFVLSSDAVDSIPTVIQVDADADLGEGVTQIQDTINLVTTNAQAAALGLVTEPPVPKV